MHEGIFSLMQMAKVSAALARYDSAGGLFISVLTNPTMGGVAASFASLGDVIFAEPKALIGFAGPRTIQATIRIELPKGFQTSEFLLEHGYIDRIVRRKDLKSEMARDDRLLREMIFQWRVGSGQWTERILPLFTAHCPPSTFNAIHRTDQSDFSEPDG